jgi:hypothetical protein
MAYRLVLDGEDCGGNPLNGVGQQHRLTSKSTAMVQVIKRTNK